MLMEELKTKQNIIGPKNINYLNKLFYILQILTSKDQNVIKKYTKLLNKKEPLPKKREFSIIGTATTFGTHLLLPGTFKILLGTK